MGTIQLTDKQQRRAGIVSGVSGGSISRTDGARLLGLGARQMRRLVLRYEREGLVSMIHGNTGRAPANKLPDLMVKSIVELCGEKGKYHGFNPSHSRDMLDENEGLRAGRSTVYTWLRKAGVVQPGKRGKQT